MRTSIGASVMTAAVLAGALGIAAPARALDLKDCEKTTSVTAQKKCLDANTKIIAKALTEGIYKKCRSKAQSNGSEGSALVLESMICLEERLFALYESAGS